MVFVFVIVIGALVDNVFLVVFKYELVCRWALLVVSNRVGMWGALCAVFKSGFTHYLHSARSVKLSLVKFLWKTFNFASFSRREDKNMRSTYGNFLSRWSKLHPSCRKKISRKNILSGKITCTNVPLRWVKKWNFEKFSQQVSQNSTRHVRRKFLRKGRWLLRGKISFHDDFRVLARNFWRFSDFFRVVKISIYSWTFGMFSETIAFLKKKFTLILS